MIIMKQEYKKQNLLIIYLIYNLDYEGLLIALDKDYNPIRFISYYTEVLGDTFICFNRTNHIMEDTDCYDNLEELLEKHPEIKHVKLIEFK